MVNVLIFGSGAVGLYYGLRLFESESLCVEVPLNIHFLLRTDFDSVFEHGISVLSPDGNMEVSSTIIRHRIHKYGPKSETGLNGSDIDWIIVTLKSTSLEVEEQADSIRNVLGSYVGANTKLIILMNGYGLEEYFGSWYGNQRIFGCLSYICVNREMLPTKLEGSQSSKLLVRHIAHGSLLLGHYEGDYNMLTDALKLFDFTCIRQKITPVDSLLYARWSKLVWNIPFSGLSLALGGVTTDVIANDPNLRLLADKILLETISLANKDIRFHHSQSSDPTKPLKLIDKEELRSFCWHLTDNMGAYKTSTVIDLVNGNAMEIEYMFNKPYLRALFLSNGNASHSSSDEKDTNTRAEVTSSLPLHDPSQFQACKWPHLQQLVLQILAIQNIARYKREKRSEMTWPPTLFNS